MQKVVWVGCVVCDRIRSWFGSNSRCSTVCRLKDTSHGSKNTEGGSVDLFFSPEYAGVSEDKMHSLDRAEVRRNAFPYHS